VTGVQTCALPISSPTGLSFGLVRRGSSHTSQLAVSDAGGGPAPWSVSVAAQSAPHGAALAAAAPAIVPGSPVKLTLTIAADTAEGDATGFVLLTRGSDVRRVPYWFRVEAPKLAREPHRTIRAPGIYRGSTAGKRSLVSSYRYPELGLACNCKTGVPTNLSGPEQVFRFVLHKRVANVGAVIVSRGRGVSATPRFVFAGDENRLVGYTGLPVDLNPYAGFGRVVPVVGAALPLPGTYDLVVDTPAGGRPGAFAFRFWINDTKPPSARLLARTVSRGNPLRIAVSDAGSGVDPRSLVVRIDGAAATFVYRKGVVAVSDTTVTPGTHRLTFSVSDYQETKNNENVGPVLPNTRKLATTFVVR